MLTYLPVRVISCRDVQLQHTKTSVLISLHFRNWIWGPTQMEGCRRASERDVIEWHSCNGWASLIVLAKKNCVQFCVDSTRSQMKMFTLSLESIHNTLETLSQCQVFSTADLVSDNWLVELTDKAQEKTAVFITEGLCELPFGLCNAQLLFSSLWMLSWVDFYGRAAWHT